MLRRLVTLNTLLARLHLVLANRQIMSVRVEGLNLLLRNLRKVSKEYPKQVKEINRRVVEPVVKVAQRRAPVRSSLLRSSIRPSSTQKVGSVSAGKASIPYAGVIHYGWPAHNIQGDPFLTDALDSTENQVYDEYERLIGQFIEKVWVDNFG